jgi:RimJ/RimL family protein N-acetyltransferase
VEIVAAVDNIGSQRVAEKVGATREGRARNRCRAGGVQFDAFVYSVIPEKSPHDPPRRASFTRMTKQ